jgi:hypothetical protein
VRGQPGTGQHDRRPPCVAGENRRGGDAAQHFDHPGGDELDGDRQRWTGHAEVEVARDREVVRERGILQVSHSRRAHARFRQSIVEPGGGAVAEVGTHRLMDRVEDLEQDEDRADEGERSSERRAGLDGADQHAHRDRECCRQGAAKDEENPPQRGETGIGMGKRGEELPFLPRGQEAEHDRILTQKASQD